MALNFNINLVIVSLVNIVIKCSSKTDSDKDFQGIENIEGTHFLYSLGTAEYCVENEIQRVNHAIENLSDFKSSCNDVFYINFQIYENRDNPTENKEKFLSEFFSLDDLKGLANEFEAKRITNEQKIYVFEKFNKGNFYLFIFLEKFADDVNIPTEFYKNVSIEGKREHKNLFYIEEKFSIDGDLCLIKNIDVLLEKKHIDNNLAEFYRFISIYYLFLEDEKFLKKYHICFFSEFQKKIEDISQKTFTEISSDPSKQDSITTISGGHYETMISLIVPDKIYYVIKYLESVIPKKFSFKEYGSKKNHLFYEK